MVEQKREVRKIPVRKVSSGEMRAELDERIRVFERRYEMSSDKMDLAFSLGLVRETAEIVEWMQAYYVRKYLNEKTLTTGTPTTITEQSMKSD
jgi:hypothetical protein